MNRRQFLTGLLASTAISTPLAREVADYVLSGEDFTVDFWYRRFELYNGMGYAKISAPVIADFRVIDRAIKDFERLSGPLSDWHHFATVRHHNEMRVFIDGEEQYHDPEIHHPRYLMEHCADLLRSWTRFLHVSDRHQLRPGTDDW